VDATAKVRGSTNLALLLADLGVTKTHARTRMFLTTPVHVFFSWYNTEHHHSGLGLLTPADVHHGLAEQRLAAPGTVLARAYTTHPERLLAGFPHPPARPIEVWINPPKTRATEDSRTRGGVLDHARRGQLPSTHGSDLPPRDCSEAPA